MSAEVYHLEIGVVKKHTDSVFAMTILAEVTMIDGTGDAHDTWRVDVRSPNGNGGGIWVRRPSVREILWLDADHMEIQAKLTYETWPWKSGSTGKIVLKKPFRNSDKTELGYAVEVI